MKEEEHEEKITEWLNLAMRALAEKNFEEAEIFVCNKFEISMREIKQLKSFYPDKYEDWMESVSRQIGVKIK